MKALNFFLVACIYVVRAAPILGLDNASAVPNSFIVVLKKDVSTVAVEAHISWANGLLKTSTLERDHTFNVHGLIGYTVKASKAVAAQIAESDQVDYIEADQTYTLDGTVTSTPTKVSPRTVQTNAPWGLARISHRQRGSTDYVFNQSTGTYIYILDTGVRISHRLFQGRASYGFNAVGGSNDDVNGHGTHVAGIASSQTYGVSRFSNIISVKILGDDGSTTTSAVISGINWAVQDMNTRGRVGHATALLAVGGSYSAALNSAVASGSSAGLFFAVAAGNENTNASTFSPGSEPSACTTGGTTIADARMPTSNYGPAIDIFAPGASIPSLWITSDTSTNILSGTSMAAAHIAGLGAYFLALEGPRTPAALCARLREVATQNVLTGVPSGTANLLAYNLSGL